MQVRNGLLAAAFAGLTIAGAHATTQAPQPPPPQPQTPPAAPGGGRQGRGNAVFLQQQRPPGDPAVIERGRALYSLNCSACHGADARGGQLGGPNLLRSQLVLADEAGEAIVPVIQGGRPDRGMPPMPLNAEDAKAVAIYLHSVLASAGRQGSPPPTDIPPLNIVVGDAAAGQAYFAKTCSSCHSPTGDLQGIASRVEDPKVLQNMWVSGGLAGGRGGRGGRGAGGRASPLTVAITLPSGETLEGPLVRIDDFIVSFVASDGSLRSVRRDGERPKVEVRDRLQRHKELLATYTDKDMHDVTAYLVTLK